MIDSRIREDWSFPDLKHMEPEEFKQVRDTIETKVLLAFKELELS